MAQESVMLGLKLPTDPRWVKLVEGNISEILTDHAWCEQKAASNAISTIVRYPRTDRPRRRIDAHRPGGNGALWDGRREDQSPRLDPGPRAQGRLRRTALQDHQARRVARRPNRRPPAFRRHDRSAVVRTVQDAFRAHQRPRPRRVLPRADDQRSRVTTPRSSSSPGSTAATSTWTRGGKSASTRKPTSSRTTASRKRCTADAARAVLSACPRSPWRPRTPSGQKSARTPSSRPCCSWKPGTSSVGQIPSHNRVSACR